MKKEESGNFYKSQEDILLVLDSYEDIFSDFDPRTYSEKALSEDFLLECRKASGDKKNNIHIRFFLPKQKRNLMDEIKIKKRMKEHFHKHFLEKKREIEKIKLDGFMWITGGSLMMVIAAYLLGKDSSFLLHLLLTLLQPAGWFFMWEGLGKIFIISKEKRPGYDFYKKMVNSKVSFSNYKK